MTIAGLSCTDKHAGGGVVRCLRLSRLTPAGSPLLAHSWPGQLRIRGRRGASGQCQPCLDGRLSVHQSICLQSPCTLSITVAGLGLNHFPVRSDGLLSGLIVVRRGSQFALESTAVVDELAEVPQLRIIFSNQQCRTACSVSGTPYGFTPSATLMCPEYALSSVSG
jgi:hypothetical protein